MTDVGHLANVSYETVSRVLHGHPGVKPATRARVLSAIEQLGYKPNTAARALVTGKSRTLGIVVIDTPDWSSLSTLYGIERGARSLDYYTSVVSLDMHKSSIREATDHLVEQSVAGVLVIAPIDIANDALAEFPETLPVVAIEGDPAAKICVVMVDQVAGARAATEHLLDARHETVFHLAGPLDWRQSRERITGWREALEAAGAEVTKPISGDWSARSGYEIGRTLARIPDMTAIFVANDQMALGLMRALGERGRRVPEDVSLVGFDDIPEAAYFSPPLTTVHQDFAEVGRASLELLLKQIDSGTQSDEHRVIRAELIVRQSCGPPPA